MSSIFETATVQEIASALDRAVLRQQVGAANIANANVGGYIAKQVTFDAHMTAMGVSAQRSSARGALPAGVTVRDRLDNDGLPQPVQLDQEVAELSQNSLNFQALTKALGKQFAMLAVAVADGKR
ncbi:Flagellar basal body rod protein FlgB [Pandoraea communis]|uniref:Flagellar basal body rod protein FlgB n=1 Tax=Pandoraea communis TaxID=2508297 RepID=A0A5E4YRB1_9BURK|nr:flagellar basal body protein [Pandoraea communis]VVE50443.1 Flagellar basal body rod protein FlgB [Pandoraea communis]